MTTHQPFSTPLSVWITTQEASARMRQTSTEQDVEIQKAVAASEPESGEFFRHIAEVMPIPTVVTRVDDGGTIIFANELFANLWGLSPRELVQHKAVEFYADPTMRQNLINELQEKGSIFNREITLSRGDGTIIWLLMSSRLTHFRDETFVVSGFQEITEHKQALDALYKAELERTQIEKEREIVNLKQEFISTVSHEFRTPMSVIVTSAQVLENYRERLTVEQQDARLQKIQEQVKHMTNLLNDVLVVNQAQTGKFKFNPEPLNLEQFCQNIADQFQLIATANHQVKFRLRGALDNVMMDVKLLEHILCNLLSNAVKYSPDGGDIHFDVVRDGGQVRFRISDNGVGIPEAAQAHLFEPFYRAKNARDIQGTGLGLAIVKDSVAAHYGSIEFQSKEGVGTTFIVELPVVGTTL